MWYDYDSFYFGKGIEISTQSSKMMRILWKHLPPGLQIRYRDTAFKSSLIFRSASILCTWAMFWFVLLCILPGLSSNFETGALKRRAELIANSAFPYSVLATSTRNGQCLSESRWGRGGGSRFCDVICTQRYWQLICHAIKPLSLRLAAKKNSVFFTLGFILIEFYYLFGTLNK